MRTMFFLIYMTLVGLCFANDSNRRSTVKNRRKPENRFTSTNEYQFGMLSNRDDQNPLKTEYYQTIAESELRVRILMRTMFFVIIYMTVVGLCFAFHSNGRSSFNKFGMPNKSTFRSMNDNPFMALSSTDDQAPLKIEYFRTITPDTGLMVGLFCVADGGFPDDSDVKADLSNLCELLDNALSEPESIEAYNMAWYFGINGSSCPIHPGVKTLTEPHVMLNSHNVTTRDLGCNVMHYNIQVPPGNYTLGENATMEQQMDLDLKRNNGTFTKNSSSIFTMPSIAVGIVIFLFASNFKY